MTVQITSGSFTAVATGSESKGFFTTDYLGDLTEDYLILEFSADGTTWDLNNPPTILGGALIQTLRAKQAGTPYVAEVKLTPTVAGQAVVYMRARIFSGGAVGAPGPSYAAVVTAYEASTPVPLMTVEIGTSSTGPWTLYDSGNTAATTLNAAVTSDGGFATAISTTARYVRVNGTTVVDRTTTTQGSVVIKWDSAGVFAWSALGPSNVTATTTQLVADDQGIVFVGQWDKAAKTLTSSTGSTYSVPAVTTGQAWLVAQLSNTGVWLGHTSIRKSTNTNSPQQQVYMGIGGNRLAIGIWLNGASGTVTYGVNDQSFTWSGFSTSVAFHPAFVVLDTTTLNGAFGGGATNVGLQAYGRASAAPDGHVAYAFNDGSSSSNRNVKVRVYDSAGTLVSSGTITTPNRDPFENPSVGIDESRVFVTSTSTGSSTQSWGINGHTRTFTSPGAVTFAMWRNDLTVNWSEFWNLPGTGSVSYQNMLSTGAVLVQVVSNTVKAFNATNGDFLWDVVMYKADDTTALSTLGDAAMDATRTHIVVPTKPGSTHGEIRAIDGGQEVPIAATQTALLVVSRDGQLLKRGGVPPSVAPPSEPISVDWPVLDLAEDATFTANVFGFDPEMSDGTAALQVWNPSNDTWVDNPVLFSPLIGGVYPASISVTMGANITAGASVAVDPATDFGGELRVLFRWKIVDSATQTRFGPAAEFVATWLSDAPTAPTGFAPTLVPEGSETMDVSWTDPIITDGAQGNFEVYLADVELVGETWTPTSWSTADTKHTEKVKVEKTSLSATDLETTLTITGKAGKFGTYRFAVKVKKLAGDQDESPFTIFEGTILEPEGPGAPFGIAPDLFRQEPETMTISWFDSQTTGGAEGNYDIYASAVTFDENGVATPIEWVKFSSTNIDRVKLERTAVSTTELSVTVTITARDDEYAGPYYFAIKVKQRNGGELESPVTIFDAQIFNDYLLSTSPNGPWTDCIVLADGTRICVGQGVVEVGSENRWVYFRLPTNETGAVGQPEKIIGYNGNGPTTVVPQRLVRDSSGNLTAVEPIFFFGVTSLRFEEGLDGVGYAEMTVASDQLLRRAQEENKSIIELLDPLTVEIVVVYLGQPVFVGPISEVEWEAGRATTYITARGLLHYFESRLISNDTEYAEGDLADIAATIAAVTQAASFGDLGIGTDTTDCGTLGTLWVEGGTTVLDAINSVSEKLDGPEVWIDPQTRTLKSAPTRGTDRRDRVRITSGVADVASVQSRGETVVTVARVVGAAELFPIVQGEGENQETVMVDIGVNYVGSFESPTGLATYGRIERTYSAPQLMSNAECAAAAERIVSSRQQTTPALTLELTITPQRNFTLTDLGIGDVVTIDLEDATFGRILGDYRIINRSAELIDQADGTYRVSLNVEPAAYVDGRLVGSRSRFNPAMATELTSLAVNQRRG
jgi:hypothetical protein